MAGIVGILGKKVDQTRVETMLEAVRHRGPDTTQLHRDGPLCAAVSGRALSDARGNGFVERNGLAVFFDGEIYNDRREGQADAEVACDLYERYGRLFPRHLKGVFACAVYDDGRLLLARDAVGVRPVYWGWTAKGDLCFASEMKALTGVSEDVHELPPGTIYSSRDGLIGYLPHYEPLPPYEAFKETADALRARVLNAVARRLEDGAVGACLLSGGLDSSIIAAAAYQLGATVPLVTVGVAGAPDLANAKLMAEHLGAEHHVFHYDTDQIAAIIPEAVTALESFDEDCVSGAISNIFAARKAAEFTNCILSGEGGDELFGGYHLLKDLPTEAERLQMMTRLIEVAYNTAVQRLDRSMMAGGVTYRTPFIDTDVIAMALQIPVRWKIHDAGNGKLIEKYVLREAFKDLLPEAIYKRPKLRFSAGTGTDGLMDQLAEQHAGDMIRSVPETTPGGYTLNSPKERWYYALFKGRFPAACFEQLVGRWDPDK